MGLLATTFYLTPILLRLLGAEDFGTFKALMELYGHFSLLEFGLSAAVISLLLPLIQKKDAPSIQGVLGLVRNRFVISAVLTALVAVIVAPFLPELVSWKSADTKPLYLTFALVASTAILIPVKPYQLYLEASNQGHRVNYIIFFQNLLFIFASVFFAYKGLGLSSQGYAVLLSTVIGSFLLWRASGISLRWKGHDKTLLQDMKKVQRSQVLNDFAMKVSLNCDQLILSAILGPLVLTKVFLGQRVVMIIQGQLQALGQSVYASLGSLYYSDVSTFRTRVLDVSKLLATLAVSLLIPVCLLNRPFISLWVGEELQLKGNLLTYLASLNAFFYGLFSFWSFLFTVLGKPHEITKLNWLQALVNIVASIVATYLIGGEGPILGTLMSFMLVPFLSYPRLLEKNYGISSRAIFFSISGPLLFGLVAVAIHHFSPVQFDPLNWYSFFVCGGLLFLISFFIPFFLFFSQEERRIFVKRVEGLWKKK